MSIFIQIPSYRDFELNKTIADAVDKASGTIRLSFGVHNCVLFDNEIEVKKNYPEWVTIHSLTSIAPKNIGLQQSRYIANEFYDGEEYYFQIDSHMRFVKDWDITLIKGVLDYQNMGLPKPLITQYPPSYIYEDDGTETHHNTQAFFQCGIWFGEDVQKFKDTLIPTQTARVGSENCGFIASVSGGMIFTLGEFAKIKPNPKIVFWGEELLIAARAFTHGFDLVMPFAHSVCHLYHSEQPFFKARRHHAWKDFPDIWEKIDTESKNEYRRIFSERVVGEGALGTARTLSEYENFSGLNFETGEVAFYE